jgi:GST-like protein
VRVFESGAILLYLAEKFGAFLPDIPRRTRRVLLVADVADGQRALSRWRLRPLLRLRPEKYEYPINRFTMEVKRQLDVLDRNLAETEFLCGDEYTIADIATAPGTAPWPRASSTRPRSFSTSLLCARAALGQEIFERPGVVRGRRVNRAWGPEEDQVLERHSAADLDR